MGCQNSFTAVSIPTVVALFIAGIANLCSWVSFTTTSWYVVGQPLNALGDIHIGLWRQCYSKQISGCVMLDGHPDSTFTAVQAFAVLGFVTLNVGNFLIAVFIFMDYCKKNWETALLSALTLIFSCIIWVVGLLVFALGYEVTGSELHYSFGLGVCAAILALVAGFVMLYVSQVKDKNRRQSKA